MGATVARDRDVEGSTAADTEVLFSDVLASILEVDRVAADSHFFDDLGADSLVMAHFCARLRKLDDAPSVSIKNVYENPTVARLAAAVAVAEAAPGVADATSSGPGLPPTEPAKPVGAWRHILCGALQLLTVLGFISASGLLVARGYDWISAGSGLTSIYLRSAAYSAALFVGWSLFTILAKWVLVGRWKAGQFRIWSLGYFRFWLVKLLLRSNPLGLFVGTPIYSIYLRMLGAKIGRNVLILSPAPVCTDLFTVGDNTVIRKDAIFPCYRANAGWIQKGPVTIGREAFVGEMTVLDIHTSIGDRAQIGHSSSLDPGQSIPDGERWQGSGAHQRTEVDYLAAAGSERNALRKVTYSLEQLLFLFGVTLPLSVGIFTVLAEYRIGPEALFGSTSFPFSSWTFFRDAAVASLILFFGLAIIRLVLALTIPRVLNLAIKPGARYPLYGIRYWAHRSIGRRTNLKFFTTLLGDSSYIVYYLRLLGYDASLEEQTGSNFGTDVKHENPYQVAIGPGTMAADGLSIINTEYSGTSFRVSPVTIGSHSYLGNNIVYSPDSKIGENCLVGTKTMIPVEGEHREGVGFLGSPSFEIPRMVMRDHKFDDLRQGDEQARRLSAKNKHNLVSIWLFLFSRWIASFAFVAMALGLADFYTQYGALAVAVTGLLGYLIGPMYYVALERASIGFRALQPLYCSMYDREAWRIERFWKLSWQPVVFNGTPFKSIFWRLMGVRLGKRVFDDGCSMIEKTMITVGDDCVLNAGSVIQPHSQEDGTFKSDHITIGSGCTLGVASLVHYGVTMDDGAALAANSFLMKGTDVPAGSHWAENPARELDEDRAIEVVEAIDPTPAATDEDNTNGKVVNVTGPAEDDGEYWHRMLQPGGFTALPRFTVDPLVRQHEVTISDDLVTSLRGLAEELQIPLTSVMLAAHGKVLAALAGEQEVITGYVAADDGQPVPCRLTTLATTWRELLIETGRAESELLSHTPFPLQDLRQTLELTEPPFEIVFDPTSRHRVFDPTTVLSVAVACHDGRGDHQEEHTLRLHYRIAALEIDQVARIAGYHLAALTLMAADPEAEHSTQSLLSADELQFQLEKLAGPRRKLPDHRFHELFEQRVSAQSDAIAAVHGDDEWSYRELNARANQLARALRARGLQSEDVVAVVTERNLHWMAAVLAIFKAGGVYLPIEPHFPADRIATTLSRSDCKLVLTEAGSATNLDYAIETRPGTERLLIRMAYGEDHDTGNLGIEVGPEQLAYIYFTSGSTGEPKGAMCEHEGMLNHLYAKIDDLEIGEGEVVAQIAPQCFDISLWQLVSALLVGGRTLVIGQDTILDPQRFVEEIVDGEVAVMQVVPSYLEVLLSYLEQNPRPLADLHCVSVTGEALKLELTQRWFEAKPDIKLANAYGLTETSDDTNHEVMDRAPTDGVVPLGRAVNNVSVYIVDEHLSPVPLGAPGEIVFSGVCVGRGYINDPERTSAAYLEDPLRPGERLYRSGDFGRWRPDGKLEYLGRRDAQVKIRGFRIEIGEIENVMMGLPGVRQGAVVVTDGSDRARQLVGFYSGTERTAADMSDQLGRSLPEYMVPAVLHWREELPLTDNGKIDRKVLTALAGEVDVAEGDVQEPQTAAEQQLAEAWAKVLGLPPGQIGRDDDFFDRGGTSLSAVELVIALESTVSLKDVTRQPVLAEMALLLNGGPSRDSSSEESGLLQLLSESDDNDAGALVCFPYAGGNAINFRAMATALRGSGLAVYAVELPGHDLTTDSEPFASMDQVVDQVVAEIVQWDPTRVLLWGHSSGTAFAIETARQLEEFGVDVQRLFLAAQLIGDPADRRAHAAELSERTNAEIAARLSAEGGYTELAALDGVRAEQIGAAYRHDCLLAHDYLLDALDAPSVAKLSIPVTVAIAADDPATADRPDGQIDWQLLAEQVEVHELVDGGHYFLRTRPTEAAEIVLGVAGSQPDPVLRPEQEIEIDLRSRKPPMMLVDAKGDVASWAEENRQMLRAAVDEHGSLLVRGLGLGDRADVAAAASRLSTDLVTETEAFAARETYPGGLYSSSAWPPKQQMCMHHELSYRLEVPGLMLFACLAVPASGGAIALADSSAVLDALPADLVERFEREGWMLTRSYNDEIGLSLAEAFGTDDRATIESYCRANAIDVEWRDDGSLRTRQRRSAVVRHPVSGQRCWFNQIAFLNEWTLNPEVHELLVDMYGGADGLPFNTRFGGGDPIGPEVVTAINDAYDATSVSEPLQVGDLLLVDNIRAAHSREPFEGSREVVVAMADPVSLSEPSALVETSIR